MQNSGRNEAKLYQVDLFRQTKLDLMINLPPPLQFYIKLEFLFCSAH